MPRRWPKQPGTGMRRQIVPDNPAQGPARGPGQGAPLREVRSGEDGVTHDQTGGRIYHSAATHRLIL